MGLTLLSDTGRKCMTVHKLVALAYHKNPDNKPIVRHRDDDRRNNTPGNLVWGTYAENGADRIINSGLGLGVTNGAAKLNDNLIREIRVSKLTAVQLGKMYGVHPSAISYARQGKTWKHVI